MSERQKFSVLMSLYIKEKPEYARECFESLINQTVQANEWVIVEDGPLTKEMYDLLDEYKNKHPGLIKRVAFKHNRGLGLALRDGVMACTYDLIARMDTDDVARTDRFEKQLEQFNNNPELDICGSHIIEFEGNINNIVAERRVPTLNEEIRIYQKRRDAFNHMTVMYKKECVLNAGNYQDCLLMEDSLLWCNMMKMNAVSMNINDALVYARVGNELFNRRGGWQYFLKYKNGRKKILSTGYISRFDYFITIVVQFIVAIMPQKLRSFFFIKVLHR